MTRDKTKSPLPPDEFEAKYTKLLDQSIEAHQDQDRQREAANEVRAIELENAVSRELHNQVQPEPPPPTPEQWQEMLRQLHDVPSEAEITARIHNQDRENQVRQRLGLSSEPSTPDSRSVALEARVRRKLGLNVE
jgi:hypothetical protein